MSRLLQDSSAISSATELPHARLTHAHDFPTFVPRKITAGPHSSSFPDAWGLWVISHGSTCAPLGHAERWTLTLPRPLSISPACLNCSSSELIAAWPLGPALLRMQLGSILLCVSGLPIQISRAVRLCEPSQQPKGALGTENPLNGLLTEEMTG